MFLPPSVQFIQRSGNNSMQCLAQRSWNELASKRSTYDRKNTCSAVRKSCELRIKNANNGCTYTTRTTSIQSDAKNLFFWLPTTPIRLPRSLASGSLALQQLMIVLQCWHCTTVANKQRIISPNTIFWESTGLTDILQVSTCPYFLLFQVCITISFQTTSKMWEKWSYTSYAFWKTLLPLQVDLVQLQNESQWMSGFDHSQKYATCASSNKTFWCQQI